MQKVEFIVYSRKNFNNRSELNIVFSLLDSFGFLPDIFDGDVRSEKKNFNIEEAINQILEAQNNAIVSKDFFYKKKKPKIEYIIDIYNLNNESQWIVQGDTHIFKLRFTGKIWLSKSEILKILSFSSKFSNQLCAVIGYVIPYVDSDTSNVKFMLPYLFPRNGITIQWITIIREPYISFLGGKEKILNAPVYNASLLDEDTVFLQLTENFDNILEDSFLLLRDAVADYLDVDKTRIARTDYWEKEPPPNIIIPKFPYWGR